LNHDKVRHGFCSNQCASAGSQKEHNTKHDKVWFCHDFGIIRNVSIRKKKSLPLGGNERSQQSTSRNNEILGKMGAEPEANQHFHTFRMRFKPAL
jgi:hypothetical protein